METEEQTGPSLTLYDGVPCFVMPDGSLLVSQTPELFDTTGGAISLADGYMETLAAKYENVDAMRKNAAQIIEQHGLIDSPESDLYSVWLLVWMTI